MSDNVTEIKQPKLSEPMVAADGSVVRVDEEGWEYDASNESRPEDLREAKANRLRVGVIGNNLLASATDVAFNTKSTERKVVASTSDVDELIQWRPGLAVICSEIPLLKNDTLDDADFLNAVNKLVKQIDCGICIRSTLNIETIERLIMSLGPDVFDAKVIYMPEVNDSQSIGDVISADFALVGGGEKALPAFMQLIKHTTHISAQEVMTGTVFEVAYAKLGLAGFKAVKQTFFNQLYDTIMDVKNANPAIVRRLMEKSPLMTDRSTMIPTFIRARVNEEVSYKQARSYAGEYLNSDVRMLIGMTDKLSLLDECVNIKNLKD